MTSPLSSATPPVVDPPDDDSPKSKALRIAINIGVALLAVLVILTMRHFLMKYFFPSHGSGKVIAKVGYLYNKVVRRAAREPDFKKAMLDLDLYDNDTLRTYENSHAEIVFNKGGEIRLDENTLITLRGFEEGLFGKPGRYNLKVESGSIILNMQNAGEVAHYIETPDQQLLLRGTEWGGKGRVGIQLQRDGDTRITAYSGNGYIEINGEKVPLNQNEFVVSGRGTKSKAKLLAPSKIALNPGEFPVIFTHRIGQEITFKWPADANAKVYTAEVSYSPKFDTTLVIADTPNDYYTFKIIGAGKYYWKVYWAQGDGSTKELKGRFRVVVEDPKALDNISIDAQRNVVSDDTGKTTIVFQSDYPLVTFNWEAVRGAASYRLEIFRDPQFQDQVLSEEVRGTSLSTKPGLFHDPQYFWQVISFDRTGQPIKISDVFQLELRFDNSMPFLSISEPMENAKLADPQVKVSGVLPQGSRIFVEGEEFQVNGRGRFSGTLTMPAGAQQIIFKAIGQTGRIEYHPRTVTIGQ